MPNLVRDWMSSFAASGFSWTGPAMDRVPLPPSDSDALSLEELPGRDV